MFCGRCVLIVVSLVINTLAVGVYGVVGLACPLISTDPCSWSIGGFRSELGKSAASCVLSFMSVYHGIVVAVAVFCVLSVLCCPVRWAWRRGPGAWAGGRVGEGEGEGEGILTLPKHLDDLPIT